MIRFVLLLAPVPVAFVGLAMGLGLRLGVDMLALGALGWCAAFAVRLPLIPLLARLGRAEWGTLLSGPAEEIARLAVVLAAVRSVEDAYAVGLGWGLVEIPYHVFETLLLHRLDTRGPADPVAREPTARLGADRLIAYPWSAWRALERYAATAIHVGLTLLVFWNPALVVATVPGHSLINVAFLRLAKRSVALAEIMALGVGSVLLLVGLLVVGPARAAF